MVDSLPWVGRLLDLRYLSHGLLHECVVEGLISQLATFNRLLLLNWNRPCNTGIVVVTCSDSRELRLLIWKTIPISPELYTVVPISYV